MFRAVMQFRDSDRTKPLPVFEEWEGAKFLLDIWLNDFSDTYSGGMIEQLIDGEWCPCDAEPTGEGE